MSDTALEAFSMMFGYNRIQEEPPSYFLHRIREIVNISPIVITAGTEQMSVLYPKLTRYSTQRAHKPAALGKNGCLRQVKSILVRILIEDILQLKDHSLLTFFFRQHIQSGLNELFEGLGLIHFIQRVYPHIKTLSY